MIAARAVPSRAFRLLLRFYPPDTRRRDGYDMWLAFRDLRADARRAGGSAVWALWRRELTAAITDGIGARLGPRSPDRPRLPLGAHPLEEAMQDLRYAFRFLRRHPAHTLVVAAILGIGVGANTGIYELAAATLWRPPVHVEAPDEIVSVWYDFNGRRLRLTHPGYRELRERAPLFTQLAATSPVDVHLAGDSDGRAGMRVAGALVSANYFTTLGVPIPVGRSFAPAEDDAPGTHPVAIVSHRLWQARFGARDDAVGSTIRVNGHPFEIIGVAPPAFRGTQVGSADDVWLPLAMQREVMPGVGDRLASTRSGWLQVLGRLDERFDPVAAAAWLDGWVAEAEAQHLLAEGFRLETDVWVGPYARETLTRVATLLGAGVVLVLLVSCANLANLLLLQAAGRREELRVRAALGARRGRLFRLAMVEGLAVALIGCAVGIGFARLLLAVLSRLRLSTSIAIGDLNLMPDARYAAVALLLAVGSAIAFAGMPAWVLAGTASGGRPATRSTIGATFPGRLRAVLVTAQVATATVLLVGAMLLVRSLLNLNAVDPGFDAARVGSVAVDLELEGYERADVEEFYPAALARLSRLPGVVAAAATERVPYGRPGRGFPFRYWQVEGGIVPPSFPEELVGEEGRVVVPTTHVTSGYFQTLAIPLVAGRPFSVADDHPASDVAIVSQPLAAALWPDSSALGQRLLVGDESGEAVEIVGVVGGVRDFALTGEPAMRIYLPMARGNGGQVALLARGVEGAPAIGPLRAVVLDLLPSVTPYDDGPLADLIGATLWQSRLLAGLVTAFGVVAVLLAGVGLYGVIAFGVATRTREIGIRVALGATGRRLALEVTRQGLVLGLAGLAGGVPAAYFAASWLRSELFGVGVADPASFLTAAGWLLMVAVISALLPARRAIGIDPARTLRRSE